MELRAQTGARRRHHHDTLDYRTLWDNKTTRLRRRRQLTISFVLRQPLLLLLGHKPIHELGQIQRGRTTRGGLLFFSAFKELVAPPPSYRLLMLSQLKLHVSPPPEHGGQGGRGEELGRVWPGRLDLPWALSEKTLRWKSLLSHMMHYRPVSQCQSKFTITTLHVFQVFTVNTRGSGGRTSVTADEQCLPQDFKFQGRPCCKT